ncbi:MAG: hypothetical protein HYW23_03660 [Candidatus Aenigmarchaeota archaeon]|nr:hypothetical protein [Candidatus Aenigmarchaeota archaeon]
MVGLDSLVLKSFFLTNLINFILLPLQALVILLRENPQAIITCGSDVALPFCYIAKLLGMKVIYIETRARITRPSRAGKLAYKIADLFFVQWSSLKRYYPKSIYAGILT